MYVFNNFIHFGDVDKKKKKKNAVKYNRLEGRILRILFRVNSI